MSEQAAKRMKSGSMKCSYPFDLEGAIDMSKEHRLGGAILERQICGTNKAAAVTHGEILCFFTISMVGVAAGKVEKSDWMETCEPSASGFMRVLHVECSGRSLAANASRLSSLYSFVTAAKVKTIFGPIRQHLWRRRIMRAVMLTVRLF